MKRTISQLLVYYPSTNSKLLLDHKLSIVSRITRPSAIGYMKAAEFVFRNEIIRASSEGGLSA